MCIAGFTTWGDLEGGVEGGGIRVRYRKIPSDKPSSLSLPPSGEGGVKSDVYLGDPVEVRERIE